MAQGSFNPQIRILGQNVCHVACLQTDTHTDTQSDYWGHPFRVSGFFPSTYHQGSAQQFTFAEEVDILTLNLLLDWSNQGS